MQSSCTCQNHLLSFTFCDTISSIFIRLLPHLKHLNLSQQEFSFVKQKIIFLIQHIFLIDCVLLRFSLQEIVDHSVLQFLTDCLANDPFDWLISLTWHSISLWFCPYFCHFALISHNLLPLLLPLMLFELQRD